MKTNNTSPWQKLVALLVATALWLPATHLFFSRASGAVATGLARRQEGLWTAGVESGVASTNPEWELMRRSFDVLGFANLALQDATRRAPLLATIDGILRSTLALERQHGQRYFLLAYARERPFRDPAGRSLFVDGQIALMLAARQLVAASPSFSVELDERVERIGGQLERGPILVGESYPDEAWTFCNVVALVALRLADASNGQDHRDLVRRWLASARAHLIDARTGLLISSMRWDGEPGDGPEGSTLWLVAPFLQLLDADFARDQYTRARRELAGGLFGFAWAREWPASWAGRADIDSGPTVPLVGANAGSSGLAFVAARAFGDEDFWRGLSASLELGGFPIGEQGERRYAAGNDLADAVLFYAHVQGPLWAHARAQGVTP